MNRYLFRKATEIDLSQIRKWLAIEHQKNAARGIEGSFYNNMGLIEKAQHQGELSVMVDRGSERPVAFAHAAIHGSLDSHVRIEIFEVHPKHRRQGLGTLFANRLIEEARKLEVIGIDGECSPYKSKRFWRTLGFLPVRSPHGGDARNWVALPLPRIHTLPLESMPCMVAIQLVSSNKTPKATSELWAGIDRDKITLAKDSIFYVGQKINNYVKISIENSEVYFGEVQTSESEKIGQLDNPWLRIGAEIPVRLLKFPSNNFFSQNLKQQPPW